MAGWLLLHDGKDDQGRHQASGRRPAPALQLYALAMEPHFKIIRGAEVKPGVFEWKGASPVCIQALSGRSRQPLLDACREIKRTTGATKEVAAIFREGREHADMFCPVETGAGLTVSEPDKGIPKFVKYAEFKRWQ